jgi:hypothetical protein
MPKGMGNWIFAEWKNETGKLESETLGGCEEVLGVKEKGWVSLVVGLFLWGEYAIILRIIKGSKRPWN